MAQSLDQIASVVEALQRRVEALETALKRTAPHDYAEAQLARMRALDDYQRREQAQLMAAHPDWLAVVRADQATLNTYLEERGLSPEPDPYHELP